MERYRVLRSQGVQQAGPRTIGYRQSEAFRGEYTKADVERIEVIIKRDAGQYIPAARPKMTAVPDCLRVLSP